MPFNLEQIKETVQSLYQILVQVSAYDQHTSIPSGAPPGSGANSSSSSGGAGGGASTGKPSAEVLSQELRTLSQTLQEIHQTASTPDPIRSLPHIPPELVQYVENGRNPDIYTREFVEQVRRGNQLLRGKQVAFGRFRDILAGEMEKALPELHDDVATVLEATGGRNRWSDLAPTSSSSSSAPAGGASSATPAGPAATSATPAGPS